MVKMWKPVYLLVAVALVLPLIIIAPSEISPIRANSAPSLEWDKTFGGTDYDLGYSVQQTSDGGYIIASHTESYGAGGSDVRLIKVSATEPEDILAYYRAYSGDADIVDTTDLLKAADDWASEVTPPGFTEPITTEQLLQLADEWAAGPTLSWGDVNDWLYQLQNLDLDAVGNSKYDLVVMDYSSDGTAAGEYAPAEIAALKNSPGGPKLVLAYMSIGEAEDYRYYWQSDWKPGNPKWLDAENPNWPGNYKVKYWYPEWQNIIFGYLDKIIAAGFDGVYLDLIDAYEYYAETRPTAEQEMVDFVVAISDYAHVTKNKPNFGIFPQNATALEAHPGYLAAVTGIGQEETYYGYDGVDNEPTPPKVTSEIESHLDKFVAAGKLALTVDYTTQQEQIDDVYQRAKDKGYIPFCTVRGLDQLTIHPGHEPD